MNWLLRTNAKPHSLIESSRCPGQPDFYNFLESSEANFFEIVLNFGDVPFVCPAFFGEFFLCHHFFQLCLLNEKTKLKCLKSLLKGIPLGTTVRAVVFLDKIVERLDTSVVFLVHILV
jgi:undecaprenyl pyrophosphate phosphatase UppP